MLRLKEYWEALLNWMSGDVKKNKKKTRKTAKKIEKKVTQPLDESAMIENDWRRLLKQFRSNPHQFEGVLNQYLECRRFFSSKEKRIQIIEEKKVLDGLVVGQQIKPLSLLGKWVDPLSMDHYIQQKIPRLREWAIGAIREDHVTRKTLNDVLVWSDRLLSEQQLNRQKTELTADHPRAVLIAEALEEGSLEWIELEKKRIAPTDLNLMNLEDYLEALAQRKMEGLSNGLNENGLNILMDLMGGWEQWGLNWAGMTLDDIQIMIQKMLTALTQDEQLDKKILDQLNVNTNKKVHEIIAQQIAAKAAKNNKPALLKRAIEHQLRNTHKTMDSILTEKVQKAVVNIKGQDVKLLSQKGLTLAEIAHLSKAKKSLDVLLNFGAKPLDVSRLNQLVHQVQNQGQVTQQMNLTTQAWRAVVKDWKAGLLGELSLKEMDKMVHKKVLELQKDQVQDLKESSVKRNKMMD